MATINLFPSAYSLSDSSSSDVSNFETACRVYAYQNDYATFHTNSGSAYSNYDWYFYTKGFDFDAIPDSARVTSFSIKFAGYFYGSSGSGHAYLYNGTTPLSAEDISVSGAPVTVYTFESIDNFETIRNCGDDFSVCFGIHSSSGSYHRYFYLFAVWIEVEYIVPNKIIYGNKTLIDLTGDTATEADVAVGKIFHLASGMIATGTMQGVEVESGTWSPTSNTTRGTISFSKTHDEPPAAFLVYDAGSTASSSSSNILQLCADFAALFGSDYGGGLYTSNGKARGVRVTYIYSSSSTGFAPQFTNLTYGRDQTGTDASQTYAYRYYATETEIKPYYSSTSYWRSTRTYKWVAIWT